MSDVEAKAAVLLAVEEIYDETGEAAQLPDILVRLDDYGLFVDGRFIVTEEHREAVEERADKLCRIEEQRE